MVSYVIHQLAAGEEADQERIPTRGWTQELRTSLRLQRETAAPSTHYAASMKCT